MDLSTVDFQSVQIFAGCEARVATSDLYTYRTRNEKLQVFCSTFILEFESADCITFLQSAELLPSDTPISHILEHFMLFPCFIASHICPLPFSVPHV